LSIKFAHQCTGTLPSGQPFLAFASASAGQVGCPSDETLKDKFPILREPSLYVPSVHLGCFVVYKANFSFVIAKLAYVAGR